MKFTSASFRASTDGGVEPLWSRDGKELFYRSGDSMMVVRVGSAASQFSRPEVLFTGRFQSGDYGGKPGTNYDVAADGRFVMIEEDESAVPGTSLHLVLGWSEELKVLVPTRN